MKASTFYRIAAILLLLFAAGHTLAFSQTDPQWGIDPFLHLLRSIHFDIQGFDRTFWDFFLAAGFSVGVLYLFAAVLAGNWAGFLRERWLLCASRPGPSPCASLR